MPSAASRDPELVGPYRIVQRLGEGGMGIVHLGLDPGGRAVAVKVLRAHVAADPDARRRLAREVATLRRVRHPRVAAVLDADVDGDLPYLVTSFVPGKPIDVYVREHGPLPRGHVARIGSVLADALRTIHAAGVVHRDVKPANVMLLDGEPWLIDFGIAHLADESRITSTGLVMGTPGYLSPEVVAGHPVTAATDWWGWGATLAFAATGRAPFGTGPVEVVLDRVRRGAADLSGMDAGLRQTLSGALSVEPARRPPPSVLVGGLAATVPRATAGAPPAAPAAASAGNPTVVVPPPVGGAVTERVLPPALPPTRRFDPPARAPNGRPPVPPNGTPNRPPNGMPKGVAQPQPGGRYPVAPAPYAAPAAAYRPAGQPGPPARPSRAVTPYPPPPPAPAGGAIAAPASGPVAPAAPRPDGFAALPDRPPRELGRGVLVGVLVVLAAMAMVAPYGAVWVSALVMALARTVDRSSTALLLRRHEHGKRGSDVPVAVLALPWHLLLALLITWAALILPLLVGTSVVFIVGVLQAGSGEPRPGDPGSLAVGMVALLLSAWWGLGGGSVRRGSRVLVRTAVRGRRSRIVVWAVLALILVSALTVASNGGSPDWGPWQDSPIVRQINNVQTQLS